MIRPLLLPSPFASLCKRVKANRVDAAPAAMIRSSVRCRPMGAVTASTSCYPAPGWHFHCQQYGDRFSLVVNGGLTWREY